MMTLEKILQVYFNSKNPLNKNGNFTEAGSRAYGNLTSLIYDLSGLIEIDVHEIIEQLDHIANDNVY